MLKIEINTVCFFIHFVAQKPFLCEPFVIKMAKLNVTQSDKIGCISIK